MERQDFDAALDQASAALERRLPRLDALAAAKRVALYTYGTRGTDLALQLRAIGVECVVFDNDPRARARAAADGFEVSDRLADGLPVIVAAGQNQVEILAEVGPGAFSLADALYGYDIANSYGRARGFTRVTAERRDDLYARYQAFDADSRRAYLDVLLYRASLDVNLAASRLPVGQMWVPPDALDIRSFCDVGAYDGDTLRQMKGLYPALERSFTVEPNADLEPVIAKSAAALGVDNRNYAGAAWSRKAKLGFRPLGGDMVVVTEVEDGTIEADALDHLTGGATYDYVKFDVESAEKNALKGGEDLLRRARCVAVASYHLPADLIDIPLQLEGILGDGWTLRFRHYSQSFDDSIVYAVRL